MVGSQLHFKDPERSLQDGQCLLVAFLLEQRDGQVAECLPGPWVVGSQLRLKGRERSLQEGSYDPARSFNRWMWLKAHTVFVEYCRTKAKQPGALPEDADVASGSGGGQEAVEAKLDAGTVLTRLRAELEDEPFEMFVLFYGEGHSVTEVATITGRDRKTVRKRLQTAKRAAVKLL